VVKPEEVRQVKLPQKKVKPTSDDFKNKILAKYPNGVTNDGRRYADIPPAELTKMIADKFPEWVTNEWVPYKDYLSTTDKISVGITWLEKKPWANIAGAIKQTGWEMFTGLTQPIAWVAKWLYKWATDIADLADLSMEKAPEDRGIIQKTLANVGTGIKEYATADIKNLREEPSAWNFGALFNPISEAKVGAAARVVNRGLADFIGSAMQTALTPEAQQTVATTLAPIGAVFETVLSKVPEWDRRDTAEALLNLLPLKVPWAKNLATWAKTIGTKSMWLLDNIRTSPVGRPIESIVGKWIDLATTRPSFLPTAEKAIAKNVDTLTQVNIGTRAKDTVVRNQTRGFDPYKDIATHQEALPTVTKEGKIITKWEWNAVSRVEDAIYGINDKLTEAIKSEWVRIPLDEFQARALNSAKQYLEEWDLYNKIIKQIRSDFEVYKRFTDEQGRIDLAKVNEIKKAKYGRSNYANPDVDLGNKTVGRAAKELVEENATWAEVKSINNEMARWYAVRDLLEAMDGKTVKWGRLGKYSARIVGNIIGSYFWPFWALAWGEISTAIQSGIMKWALKDTGVWIQTPDIIKNLWKKPIELPPSQTSSSKKANIPTPKQPAQASVLPIKEKELWTSQKVSLEKVNNPIIQKLPKKQETPKTLEQINKGLQAKDLAKSQAKNKGKTITIENKKTGTTKTYEYDKDPAWYDMAELSVEWGLAKKVETPQVDTELASLQKLQESLPWLPKVEVPADYVPKDWLPTWTEFESTILPTETKVKGKIPSPDIKRPQIRWIDLGIRWNMIKSLKEQGIFTDSFFAITDKNLANKFIDYAEQKAMKKWASTAGKEVDIKSLMDRAKNSADTSLVPQEYVKWLDWDKGIYLRFDLWDGNKVAVNSSYTDIFFKNFDDVTFKWSNEVSPVVVYSKGKDVGVIMPIKDPYASKEVLWDFTIWKAKTPQVEGRTEFTNPIDWKVQDPMKIPKEYASWTTKQKNEYLDSLAKYNIEQWNLDLVDNVRLEKFWPKAKTTKPSLPLSQKSEGKTLEQWTFWGVKWVQPKNQAKFNQWDNFEPVRVVMDDKDAQVVRYGALRNRGLKKWFTSADNAEMRAIERELWMNHTEIVNRSEEIKKMAREVRSAKEEVILDLTKKKSALPLSQKSEVKYSKPDTLVQEARKYKSAEEFVKAQGNPVYHWTGEKFDKFELQNSKNLWPNAIYFTPSKDSAQYYARWQYPSIKEAYVDKSNLFDYENPKDVKKLWSKLEWKSKDEIMWYETTDYVTMDYIKEKINSWDYGFLESKHIQEIIKDLWFDGFYIKDYTWPKVFAVYKPDKIKTKQQLLDIYNKANKK